MTKMNKMGRAVEGLKKTAFWAVRKVYVNKPYKEYIID